METKNIEKLAAEKCPLNEGNSKSDYWIGGFIAGYTAAQLEQSEMVKLNSGKHKSLGINNGIDPCPFCGAKEGDNGPVLGQDAHRWMITCLNCNVQFIDDRKDKVQSHWNRRATEMVKKSEVVELIKSEIDRMSPYKSNRGRILALENVLTKLKDL